MFHKYVMQHIKSNRLSNPISLGIKTEFRTIGKPVNYNAVLRLYPFKFQIVWIMAPDISMYFLIDRPTRF